jgi:oligosaccharide repeat unit polymerase
VVTGNVGTYMIYPYYDFGVVGVAVGALLLGALATWLEGAVLIARRVQLMPAACIVLTTVVMSFFGLSLVRDARWLFLLVAAVYLTRYVRVSPDQLAPDTGPASSARSSIPIPARCMDSES